MLKRFFYSNNHNFNKASKNTPTSKILFICILLLVFNILLIKSDTKQKCLENITNTSKINKNGYNVANRN